MANNNPETNAPQTDSPGNNAVNTSAQRKDSDEARKPPTVPSAAPTALPLRAQSATNLAARVSSPSPASSPRTSRNASPVRKDSRPQPLAGPISTQPSAAAIQRALSAANAPSLQQGAVTDAVSKLSRPSKSGETTPHWPSSPRMKSPPPSGPNSRRGSSTATQKKADAVTTPGISVQKATPEDNTAPLPKQSKEEVSKTASLQTPHVKVPSRGASGKSTLETVQENSADDAKEPSPAALAAAAEMKPLTKLSDDENQTSKREPETEKPAQQAAESGSESAGTKSPQKRDTSQQTSRPKNAQNKSYASLSSKARSADAKQAMTVETETVPSVPQSALNVDRSGTGRGDNSGSIKQKASSEAIRPKKDRKRTATKARSINSSTVSSKADIFEQRVANAVDEANSSESDETFVYESNPPEPQRRARHHSRTPSAASSHDVADQQRSGIRNFGDSMDDSRRVAGKRSMKFSNNAQYDPDSPEGKNGSVRSHTPRHFGRFGRGGSQQSMFDSPFTQASKLRSNQRSRPGSPRSPSVLQQQQKSSGLFARKQEPDFDGEVGDDERTPLVGTVRTQRLSRSSGSRRMPRSPSYDDYYNPRRQSSCARCSSWTLAAAVLFTVVFSAVAFLVMSNRPLYDVELLQIKNVLASEQEIIMDLCVTAVNPNALGITITDMDLDIFAKSKQVGSGGGGGKSSTDSTDASTFAARTKRNRKRALEDDESWHDQNQDQDLSKFWRPSHRGGVDKGTDPLPPTDDLDPGGQTMLLGRVFHFDQALSFDGSPLKRHAHNSTAELRLDKPGNKTETGGSARWERVLTHDFELIVRGSLKYQLPISSRLMSVAIGRSVVVHPEGGVDDGGSGSVSEVERRSRWTWVEWED